MLGKFFECEANKNDKYYIRENGIGEELKFENIIELYKL